MAAKEAPSLAKPIATIWSTTALSTSCSLQLLDAIDALALSVCGRPDVSAGSRPDVSAGSDLSQARCCRVDCMVCTKEVMLGMLGAISLSCSVRTEPALSASSLAVCAL